MPAGRRRRRALCASPKLRVFALDAATGTLKWSFDPNKDAKTPSRTRIRGLMYWERGNERRIYFGARHWLYALDAATGQPIPGFGQNGRIDLREGFDGRDPRTLSVGVNTPGVVYNDLLILGSVVPEGLPSAPGDIRAFDVHTGKARWSFHTIPHPGELGYDTWPADAWKYAGGANAWSGVSLDETRGLVFVATGSTSYDFYGANRHGDNLFANSVICLPRGDGRAGLALPGASSTISGTGIFLRHPCSITMHEGRRPPRCGRADREERAHVRPRPRNGPTASFRWRSVRSGVGHSR